MRNHLIYFVLMFSSAAMIWTACSRAAENNQVVLSIQIPDDLRDSKESIEYINQTTLLINQYTVRSEVLAKECYRFPLNKSHDLQVDQKVQLVKALGGFTAHYSLFTVKYLYLNQQAQLFEAKLSGGQQNSLHRIQRAFDAFLHQVNLQYSDIHQFD